jgi:hypothetical protein
MWAVKVWDRYASYTLDQFSVLEMHKRMANIVFFKNRPLRLEGHLRSLYWLRTGSQTILERKEYNGIISRTAARIVC